MIKSKAIDIIKKLSDKEAKSLGDFLESPFFNKKKKVTELFNLIIKNLHLLDEKEVSEEIIFAEMFRDREFSYSFIRNLMSELLNLCELFLVFNNFRENSFDSIFIKRILLREYNERFLDSHFKLKLKNIQNAFKEREIDSDYYDALGKFEAESIAYDIYRSSMENVPEKTLIRSRYNLCMILQLIESDVNDLTVNKSAFNINPENELLFEILKSLDFEKLNEKITNDDNIIGDELEIRLRLIQLSLDSDNSDNYNKLKVLIFKRINKYSNSEISNMFIKLKNYCANKIYKGDYKYYEEKYSLLKQEIKSVKYNSNGNGPLFVNIFLEIIQIAFMKKEIDYAKNVIKKFIPELEKSKQNSVKNLCEAMIEFHNKNYEKSLTLLSGVNAFNMLMKHNCKLLYLKIYYETNALETGLSLLDSFIHYINETKELNSSRKAGLKKNYVLIKNLYKIKINPEKYTEYDIQQFRNEVENSGIFYNGWYLEKAGELSVNIKKI